MIHIATVHWELDDWVDIQLKYLNRHIQEPFQVYAYLNRLKIDHAQKFFYSSTEDIKAHAVKLNLLADHICATADDNDLLIFIDGDALPVGDIITYGREKLQEYKLIAVQRRENFGDDQPHPCFCLTTVGFWKEIDGDWLDGYIWKNLNNKLVNDVGGNLLKLLREKQVAWYPMLRSNKKNLHPLFFGVYDDLIYHHGAGFRSPYSRVDGVNDGKTSGFNDLGLLEKFHKKLLFKRNKKKTKKLNSEITAEIFNSIQTDDSFYREFI